MYTQQFFPEYNPIVSRNAVLHSPHGGHKYHRYGLLFELSSLTSLLIPAMLSGILDVSFMERIRAGDLKHLIIEISLFNPLGLPMLQPLVIWTHGMLIINIH